MKTKKYFGESAFYPEGNLIERENAKVYLEFWKKNLIYKLQRDSFDIVIFDEQWIERPAFICGMLAQNASLGLKLCLEADFHYELKPY
jgi:hypothetical protein